MEEVESARLMDFELRLRARTMRLLAAALGEDTEALFGQVAEDQLILDQLTERNDRIKVESHYAECRSIARAQLIDERGDPTPHKLG